jgi:anti-sigma regulatory factor (Ser/Thr protein kinase)
MENLAPLDLSEALAAEHLHLRIPSRLDWITPTVDFLGERAVRYGVCDEAFGRKLRLALHEALNNSVIHGNLEVPSELKERGDDSFGEALAAHSADPRLASRTVDIRVEYDGHTCHWALTDEGRGFDVERALLRIENPDPEQLLLASGRGILMMRAFLDEVRYEAGGSRVLLTLHRRGEEGRRRHPRVPVQQSIRVVPVAPDGSVNWAEAQDALLRNLSPSGLALLQSGLSKTDHILVGLCSEGQPYYVPAEVRHWQRIDDHIVELGCRFQIGDRSVSPPTQSPEPAGDNDIGAFVARLVQQEQVHRERRRHPRVPYTECIHIQGADDADPVVAFPRDISRSGIAFVTTKSLDLEIKRFILPQRKDRLPLHVRARILRCSRVLDGFYDAAAVFLDSCEI